MYVIKNIETGKYVARPGSEHSYTNKLESAEVYWTKESADANRCRGNEIVISIDGVLTRWPK